MVEIMKVYDVKYNKKMSDGSTRTYVHKIKYVPKGKKLNPLITDELQNSILNDIDGGEQKKIVAIRYGINYYYLEKILKARG